LLSEVELNSICAIFVIGCSALQRAGSPQRAATELFETHAWFAGPCGYRNHVGNSWDARCVGVGSRRFVLPGCGLYTPTRRQFLYRSSDATDSLNTAIRVRSRKQGWRESGIWREVAKVGIP
jgi:hypothetical protein